MTTERKGLSNRLSGLLHQVEDSNWRIAITTTDLGQCLKDSWILEKKEREEEQEEVDEQFETIIGSELTEGNSNAVNYEKQILMAINALGGDLRSGLSTLFSFPSPPPCRGKRESNNPTLPRSDSSIAVIIVTDELNYGYPYTTGQCYDSRGNNNTHTDAACGDYVNPMALYNYLENNLSRAPGETFKIHGILSENSKASYEKIISDSGGHLGVGNVESYGKVNEQAYNDVIDKISVSIYEILANEVDISSLVDSKTDFKLKSVSVVRPNGTRVTILDRYYSYQKKIITLKMSDLRQNGIAITRNDDIEVSYSYTKIPYRDSFDLTWTPLPGSVERSSFTNCASWNNKRFKVNGKEVTFEETPPTGCKVTFAYKKNQNLKRYVWLSEPGFEIHEVRIGSGNTMSFSGRSSIRLTLNPVPDDNETLDIFYKYRKKKLKYEIELVAGLTSPQAITCTDVNGRSLPCTYSNGNIQFGERYFTDGKKVRVKQPLASTANISSLTLKSGYQADTLILTIADSGGSDTCSGNELHIQGGKIMLKTAIARSRCSALESDEISTVTLKSYKYLAQKEFEVDDNHFFTYHQHRSESWEVTIDGSKLDASEYELDLETRTVTLKTQPAAGAEVKIMVTLKL